MVVNFKSESAPGPYVPHNSIGPDLSFLNKKMKFRCPAHASWLLSLDKKTSHAQIMNLGNFVTSITAPKDPHALACLDSRVEPP